MKKWGIQAIKEERLTFTARKEVYVSISNEIYFLKECTVESKIYFFVLSTSFVVLFLKSHNFCFSQRKAILKQCTAFSMWQYDGQKCIQLYYVDDIWRNFQLTSKWIWCTNFQSIIIHWIRYFTIDNITIPLLYFECLKCHALVLLKNQP